MTHSTPYNMGTSIKTWPSRLLLWNLISLRPVSYGRLYTEIWEGWMICLGAQRWQTVELGQSPDGPKDRYPHPLLVLHEHINQILFLRRPSVVRQSGHEVPAEETL